ncbi:MAG: hypothetical protein V3V84_00645 [Candidatus Bathyarchaeia archaeon]
MKFIEIKDVNWMDLKSLFDEVITGKKDHAEMILSYGSIISLRRLEDDICKLTISYKYDFVDVKFRDNNIYQLMFYLIQILRDDLKVKVHKKLSEIYPKDE